jgi:hypothetical protein
MKLLAGDIIGTYHGIRPFEVLNTVGGFTWPLYLDELNGNSRKTPPRHLHIICCRGGVTARKANTLEPLHLDRWTTAHTLAEVAIPRP